MLFSFSSFYLTSGKEVEKTGSTKPWQRGGTVEKKHMNENYEFIMEENRERYFRWASSYMVVILSKYIVALH